MRRIILLLTMIVITFNAMAIERYVSRPVADGILYFIMPKKLDNVKGVKSLEYDMTMVSSLDSVTVNFTVYSPIATAPTDLRLISGTTAVRCDNYKLLFVDKAGKNYEIRVTSSFPRAVIEDLFSSDECPGFEFRLGSTAVAAYYKPGAWKKDREKMTEVFNLIKLIK